MQMLRAPAARGARNKGCYFWTRIHLESSSFSWPDEKCSFDEKNDQYIGLGIKYIACQKVWPKDLA
jgi:hypothetical protein